MIWHCGDFRLDLNKTRVMAIVNVTPDSFSDGGRYFRPEEAAARARNCLAEGADILDLGGESTRPGATPLEWKDEWSRLEPVLALMNEWKRKALISIDTYHPETAERALAAGAAIINCVYPEPVPAMAALARKTGCGLVVPIKALKGFNGLNGFNSLKDLNGFNGLKGLNDLKSLKGLEGFEGLEQQVLIDPMIGFDTTREEDLALMGALRRLAQIAPVLVGVSRKRLIKKLTGEKCTGKNLGGSVGAAVWCAMAGASVVRVHDVRETVQALAVVNALAAAEQCPQQTVTPTTEQEVLA